MNAVEATRRFMDRWPLQLRVAATASLILLFGLFGLMAVQQKTERDGLLAHAQHREQEGADRTADIINQRIAGIQRALQLVSEGVTSDLMKDQAGLQEYFRGKPVVRAMFANMLVATPDGTVLFWVDEAGLRSTAFSIADRAYFQLMLKTRAAVVSEPVMGRFSGEPVIVFAQPILAQGQVIGMMGGALRLASRDLLSDLAAGRYRGAGQTIVTDAQGRVLAHARRDALLRPLFEVEDIPATILQQKPPSPQLSDWSSAEDGKALLALGRVPTTGWLVWRVLTEQEITEPLAPAQRRGLYGAALLVLILSLSLFATLRRQFRPMAWLAENASKLADGSLALPQDVQKDRTEVGTWARAMERVLRERGETERELRAVQGQLHVVLNASPVAMAFTRDRRFELVNHETERLLGWPDGGLVGREAVTIFASAEEYAAMGARVAQAFDSEGVFSAEMEMRHSNGGTVWVRLQGRPADASDPMAGTIWSLLDIRQQRRERERLVHAASHDPLTGLANREAFMDRLSDAWTAAQSGEPAAVLMMDLDRFKPLNDSHGHAAGDAMLVAVANELRRPVRAQDLLARLGGDEFAVILSSCPLPIAQAIAARIAQSIAHLSLQWKGTSLNVGISIGLAAAEPDLGAAAQWLAEADIALYKAKRQGRGQVVTAPASVGAEPMEIESSAGQDISYGATVVQLKR